ncbi:MAG: hypothetical protein HC900_09245 [Methylacidiphilales bacterium]|nr:hypothetical protein [Candidatus Methylacidiphilales bacterium]
MLTPRHGRLDLKAGRVEMTHGAGGRAMAQLIAEIFRPALANEFLAQGNDQAILPLPAGGRLAMTTDGYVVSPLFFPGGDIGSLAIHGTINDLAMAGAAPLYLTASFVVEEGFALADLARIAASIKAVPPIWVTAPIAVQDSARGAGNGGASPVVRAISAKNAIANGRP